METYRMKVERVDVVYTKSFFEVVTALERHVPMSDLSVTLRMIASRASAREMERAIGNMVGDSGFMVLAKLDQGPLVSLLGKRKRMTLYYLGNPVIANQMFEIHPEIGLYAPLRALIYEDYSGVAHFTYDQPTSMLQQFQHERVTAVGRLLDDKMAKLAESVVN